MPPGLSLCLSCVRIPHLPENTQQGALPMDELNHISCVPLALSFMHEVQSLPPRSLPSVSRDKANIHLPLERGESSMKTCAVRKCFLEGGDLLEGLDRLTQKWVERSVSGK